MLWSIFAGPSLFPIHKAYVTLPDKVGGREPERCPRGPDGTKEAKGKELCTAIPFNCISGPQVTLHRQTNNQQQKVITQNRKVGFSLLTQVRLDRHLKKKKR